MAFHRASSDASDAESDVESDVESDPEAEVSEAEVSGTGSGSEREDEEEDEYMDGKSSEGEGEDDGEDDGDESLSLDDAIAASDAANRAEQAAAKGVEELRYQFEMVTRRNGLRGDELSSELADMITRPEGMTAQLLAATYQIDDDDAAVLLKWARAACQMRDELGYQGLDAI